MTPLQQRIHDFFVAAEALAQQIAEIFVEQREDGGLDGAQAHHYPGGDPLLIPVLVDIDVETVLEVFPRDPSCVCYGYGIKSFNDPNEVIIDSIKPTLGAIGADDEERIPPPDRLIPGCGGVDVAYFNTNAMYQSFDWGAASREHPLKIRVRPNTMGTRVKLNMIFIGSRVDAPPKQDAAA